MMNWGKSGGFICVVLVAGACLVFILVGCPLPDPLAPVYPPSSGGSFLWAVCGARDSALGASPRYVNWFREVEALPGGSAFVLGEFVGKVVLGEGTPNEVTLVSDNPDPTPYEVDSDGFIARYSSDGDLVWARSFISGSQMGCSLLTSFPDGSCLCILDSDSSVTYDRGGPFETQLEAQGYLGVRLGPDGSVVWAKPLADNPWVWSATGLSDGTFWIGGTLQDLTTFGPGDANQTMLLGEENGDPFIAKYDVAGRLLWARVGRGVFQDTVRAVSAWSEGPSVICGDFYEKIVFGAGEPHETTLTAATAQSFWGNGFLAKYDSDGSLNWATGVYGDIGILVWGVSAAADGSCFITGQFDGYATFGRGEPNETTFFNPGTEFEHYMFVAKYNADGTLAWARQTAALEPYTRAYVMRGYRVAGLPDGGCIVLAEMSAAFIFNPGMADSIEVYPLGRIDFILARYDNAGGLVWVKHVGPVSPGPLFDVDIAADEGTCLVVGAVEPDTIFGYGEPNETRLEAEHGGTFIAKFPL